MTNTETIKAALIKQIVDSGSALPLSVLEGNIDLLINTALTERYDAIYTKVIGSHITEPELKVEDLKAGEWYVIQSRYEWLVKYKKISIDGLKIEGRGVCTEDYDYHNDFILYKHRIESIRHATREEIIKYFPHEFEIDAHGANDIPQVTDPHI
jgi:hypothetical protein